jgi:hypothetical protein
MQNRICYLGNSLTAQNFGYLDSLHAELTKRLSIDETPIRSGLGGVGSMAVAVLCDYLVFRHKPRICFVETFTGDVAEATPLHLIDESLGTIISGLIEHNILPIFLFIPRIDVSREYSQKVFNTYQRVLERFRIPYIDVRFDLEERMANVSGSPESMLQSDRVHLTKIGGEIVGNLIAKKFVELKFDLSAPGYSMKQLSIQAPFHSLKLKYFNDISTWKSHGTFKFVLPYIRILPKDKYVFNVLEEAIAILCIADPSTGILRIDDAREIMQYQIHDQWCTFSRIQCLPLLKSLKYPSEVTLSVGDWSSTVVDSRGLQSFDETVADELKLIGIITRKAS